MDVIRLLLIYLAAVNVLGFVLMGVDKWKAQNRAFRIPEATLFLAALLGGSIGSIAGMYLFRHKTKHWYFVFGMPAILVLQLVTAFLLFYSSSIEFITM